MDKFTKDKIKKINHLLATIAHEVKHIRHLMHHKHPRSMRSILNQTNKIYKAYLRIKILYMQIRIIQETPIPKFPKGGVCGMIDERGPEMVTGCNPYLINPIKSVTLDMKTNKVVDIKTIGVGSPKDYSLQMALAHIIASKK